MVEGKCYFHSNMIRKGKNCIDPLSVSFGIKGKGVLYSTTYHFTCR